jgi:hypothetical protein
VTNGDSSSSCISSSDRHESVTAEIKFGLLDFLMLAASIEISAPRTPNHSLNSTPSINYTREILVCTN